MYSWNDGVLIELSRIEIVKGLDHDIVMNIVLIELSRIEMSLKMFLPRMVSLY